MSSVDGFLAGVPLARRQGYLEHARQTAALFLEYGALQVTEIWGDDVPHGQRTDFHRAV